MHVSMVIYPYSKRGVGGSSIVQWPILVVGREMCVNRLTYYI
jgi:hypothetical protein